MDKTKKRIDAKIVDRENKGEGMKIKIK